MKMLNYLMILALLSFFSCSNSDNDLEDFEDDDIELVDEGGDDLDFDEEEDVDIVDSEDEDFDSDFEDGDLDEDLADEDLDDDLDEDFSDDEDLEVADLDDDEGFDDEFNEEFVDDEGDFLIADDSDDFSDDLGDDDLGDDDIALDDDLDEDINLDDEEDDSLLADDEPAIADNSTVEEPALEEPIEGPELASADFEEEQVDTSSDFPAASYDEPEIAASPSPDYSSVQAPSDASGSYTVQRNETLMMISYKLYGDYSRWKEIAAINAGKLNGGTIISEGMVLSYSENGAGFSASQNGEPYLIQWGDTLGKISNQVYGQTSRWKEIWDNNRPMIKDPNKIYTGFTLFYVPDGGVPRETAAVAEEASAPAANDIIEEEEAIVEDVSDDLSLEDEDFPEL